MEGTAVYNNETEKIRSEALASLNERLGYVQAQLKTLEPQVTKFKEEEILIKQTIDSIRKVDK